MNKRKLYEGEDIRSFKELIERYETRYKDKLAFIYKLQPKAKEYIQITYSQFAHDIKSLATALLTKGLAKKRIAIISPNRYEWCVSYLAITTSDIIVVPLDKSLPENEIKSLIQRSKVDAVIFDKEYNKVFEELKQENSSSLQHYICMDDAIYKNLILEGKESLANGCKLYEEVMLDPTEMSIMLFTSGTTSTSKAVALSQSNICADLYALSQMAKITEKDTFLSFLPLHHTFESTCTFLYGTSCGISIAFCDGIRYIADNLKEYKITGFVCVPLILEVMHKKVMKGVEAQGKTKLVSIMGKVSQFLLHLHIDIRKKLFKQILNNIDPHLRLLIAGRCTYE